MIAKKTFVVVTLIMSRARVSIALSWLTKYWLLHVDLNLGWTPVNSSKIGFMIALKRIWTLAV